MKHWTDGDVGFFSIMSAIIAMTMLLMVLGLSGAFDATTVKRVVEPHNVVVRNATNYADWCGGYVQIEKGEVYVEGCDR